MSTWRTLRNNPSLWPRYFIRELVISSVRRFFADRQFHEIETPYLTGSLPPESYLDIFETTLLTRDRKPRRAYLPTSPEPFLKKLLVAGIGNCYTICKSFRNTEDKSTTHTPEFTILEWYRAEADYTDIMRDCEELLLYINTYLQRTGHGNEKSPPSMLEYQGSSIDLSAPWERLSMCGAFEKFAHVDLEHALDREHLAPIAKAKGYTVRPRDSWEELFHQIFFNEVEPFLGKGKPVILYDYPVSLAALSRIKKSDPRFAERFEFYIEGLELGDAYSELTDWKEQNRRFREENEERKRLGKVMHPIDHDFVDALKVGMPKAGGIAVGVDRLIMLFADVTSIHDTLFFPHADLFE